MIQLSRRDARRVAVVAAGLTSPRPVSIEQAMARIGSITVDETPYVAGSVALVLASRLGRRFSLAGLTRAIERHELVEVRGQLRRARDLALYRAEMDAWPGPDATPLQRRNDAWTRANHGARDAILQTLRNEGPLPPRALVTDFAEPYRSTGWNDDKSTAIMLERLDERGLVAVSRREGRERWWDLAERVYPAVTPVPAAEGRRRRDAQRLGSQGVTKEGGSDCNPGVGDVGEPVRIEGLRGRWRVDPTLLDAPWRPRTAILSPFDPLVVDRDRLGRLWDFDYALEMYKPASQRRWGYYALPVLHGADLVGKVDVESDRGSGVLHLHAIHRDTDWSSSLAEAVDAELRALARALELELEI